ncbi:hypothetical protein AAVH_12782 [Aphelenchoides avenae]|nr:hypothetical protein AAVH_12782 [Aphelenchus avenae]
MRDRVSIKTNRTVILAMKDESMKKHVRDLSKKYEARIQVPHDWSGVGGPPTYMFITGNGAKLLECQRELCELYAFIEKRKAERMKAEVAAKGGAPSKEDVKNMSPVHVLAEYMPARLVERYFSEENQKKLKEVEEGKREWEPFFSDIF